VVVFPVVRRTVIQIKFWNSRCGYCLHVGSPTFHWQRATPLIVGRFAGHKWKNDKWCAQVLNYCEILLVYTIYKCFRRPPGGPRVADQWSALSCTMFHHAVFQVSTKAAERTSSSIFRTSLKDGGRKFLRNIFTTCRTLPYIKVFVAELSSRRSGFDSMLVHVRFLVDKVALGQRFLRVFRPFSSIIIIIIIIIITSLVNIHKSFTYAIVSTNGTAIKFNTSPN